jgi:hypothetical protein
MADELNGHIADARGRMRRLQTVVDLACAAICTGAYTRAECLQFVEAARIWADRLCPDRLDLFDMIYGRRMQRLIEQHARE